LTPNVHCFPQPNRFSNSAVTSWESYCSTQPWHSLLSPQIEGSVSQVYPTSCASHKYQIPCYPHYCLVWPWSQEFPPIMTSSSSIIC
jgi:hypothetical protein